MVVEPRCGLFFPSVDHVRNQVSKASMGPAQGSVMVVIDCSHFTGVDYSAVKVTLKISFHILIMI